MADIKLNANQRKARELLADLRADRSLSYKETLQKILTLLGSDYRVPSSEIAKGMLAAIIYTTFDYGNHRNIMFMALCLSWEFNENTIAARRRSYLEHFGIEFYGNTVTEDAVRKDEEKCLDKLVLRLSEKIAQHGAEYIDAILLYAKENRFIGMYCLGDWSYYPVKLCHYCDPPRCISKREVEFDVADEKLADGIRFKIESGVKDIDMDDMFLPGTMSMAEIYYYKYHDKHDLLASIVLVNYTDYGVSQDINYDITIKKIVDDGILDIDSSCGQHGLSDLLCAHKSPVLYYGCSCGPDPTNTYEALLGIPGSVVFHYGKIEKATYPESPDKYEGLGLSQMIGEK